MAEQKTLIAALVVVIIILAAALLVTMLPQITGTAVIPEPGATPAPTSTQDAAAGTANTNGGQTAPASATTTDVNAIASVRVSADAVDWDATPGIDGYVVHYVCFDGSGNPVAFAGEKISTTVYAYTPDTDVNKNQISPLRVIFKGFTTISSSADGDPSNPLAGIYLPFRDMTKLSTDRGVGKITLILKLPGGAEVTGSTSYLFPK
ncbi:MAG: hypothetical protein GKC04_02035 [Methanomicrobiales archaeon]|nr:hypothetical protein [Methanomicrobiales archaeon]